MQIAYETEPCSRCGGSGNYSYCQRHGTVCFKCGGGGRQLTRRGKAARAKVAQFKREHYHRRAADLRVGQTIDWAGITPGGDTYSTFAVVESAPETLDNGLVSVRVLEGRGRRPVGYRTSADAIIAARPTPEQFCRELVPYARRFKGVRATTEG